MFLLLHLIVLIAAIQDVSSLQCYAYISGANNTMIVGIQDSTVMTGVCTNSSCACASYIFQCTTGYSLCSTQQQQNQAMIWNYTLTTNTACEGFALNGTYMNVTCCYTNLCNNQGMSATPTTISMFTTTTSNSTSLLSFSIWIIFLALCFFV
jgi:hypothetical protein